MTNNFISKNKEFKNIKPEILKTKIVIDTRGTFKQ